MLLWKSTNFVEINKSKKREESITWQHSSKKKKSNNEVTYYFHVEYHLTLHLILIAFSTTDRNGDAEEKFFAGGYQTGQGTLYVVRSCTLQHMMKLSMGKELFNVHGGETRLMISICLTDRNER